MNLAEYCATCEAAQESIVNNLVQELADLKAAHEQEIQEWRHNQDICFKTAEELEGQLKEKDREIDRLKQQPAEAALSFDQQYLIDLCAQMGDNWRHRFATLADGIQEIIRASDKCQGIVSDPKTGQIVEEVSA